jgi:predicted ATP-dependent endonuclease of OLD family
MLRSVTVEGFRGYSREQRLTCAIPNGAAGSGLTIITGPNNSGKSTILELLKVRGQHQPSFHVGQRNEISDFVSITYEFDSHTETIKSLKKGSSESVLDPPAAVIQPVYYVPSRRHINHIFGKNTPADRAAHMHSYMNSGADRAPSLAGFEARVLKLEADQASFNSFLKRILPELLEWAVDQDHNGTYFIKMWSAHKKHSSAGLGEGVISAFVLAAALYDSSIGDTIVIDEPELSLHPSVQKRLMSVMEELSSNRQIIIATHSPHFVTRSALLGGALVTRTWDRDGAIEIFSTSVSQPTSGLKNLLSSNSNNPHVFGLDAREIFFLEDGVLVLEGQEDAVLWPDYVDQDANKYNIFGWGAGGASNVSSVLALLQCLGFRNVAAILDNDQAPELIRLQRKYPQFMCDMIPAPDIRTKAARPAIVKKIGLLDSSLLVREGLKSELIDLVQRLHAKIATKDMKTNLLQACPSATVGEQAVGHLGAEAV